MTSGRNRGMRAAWITLALGVLSACASGAQAPGVAAVDLLPGKARHAPGEEVTLTARVRADEGGGFAGAVDLAVYHRERVVHSDRRVLSVAAGASAEVEFRWTPPEEDFRGYLAAATAGGRISTTGIDVSSTPWRFPRYGYVSDYSPDLTPEERDRRVERLSREFLISAYQLYDWGWRHEKLIERTGEGEIAPVWTDLFGRAIAWDAVRGYVDAMHRHGAAALGYVMVYAAREGYAERWPISPGWGLFAEPGGRSQLNAQLGEDVFLWLFDPMNPAWIDWMAADWIEAVREAGFDGVHVDQLGPRHGVHLADGTPIDLAERFAPFLREVKRRLAEAVPSRSACIFNLVDGRVDGWAVDAVAGSDTCEVLYSEIWFEANTYDDLRRYAEYLRARGDGRAAVFAAYSQYGEQVGRILEAEHARLASVGSASDHPGFTGDGFVAALDVPGASITWTVELAEVQTVSLVFRFANASGEPARRVVSVDGRPVGEVTFFPAASWDSWSSDAWVATEIGAGTHEVTLAVRPGDSGAVNVDHLALGSFEPSSVRLTDAVMFASGATHIELGDDVAALAHEYYPNRSKSLSPDLQRALRRYYTFAAAYENLLFDPEVVPVDPATASLEVLSGQRLDRQGAGVVHPILRRAPDAEIVHLVNLVGVDDDRWRNAAQPPEPQTDVRVRYRLPEGVRATGVFVASPDLDGGIPRTLEFDVVAGSGADAVEVTVPRLEYWDMLVIGTAPAVAEGARRAR